MTIKNKPIVLFFLASAVPTAAETEAAARLETNLRANVKFRNGRFPGEGAVEPCDFVAGNAPANYTAKISYVDEAEVVHAPTTAPNVEAGTSGETVDPQAPVLSALAAEVGTVNGGWGTP